MHFYTRKNIKKRVNSKTTVFPIFGVQVFSLATQKFKQKSYLNGVKKNRIVVPEYGGGRILFESGGTPSPQRCHVEKESNDDHVVFGEEKKR